MTDRIASEVLLAMAQQGDAEALERLLAVSQPAVRRMALSQCASSVDADDAVQTTLLMVYRHLGALRTLAAFPGWLYSTVRRECWRLSRKLFGQVEFDEGMKGSDDASPDLALQYDLITAIRALPPLYRQALILRDIQQLTAAEVAARLGLTEEAVKSRLHRARRLLRAALTD